MSIHACMQLEVLLTVSCGSLCFFSLSNLDNVKSRVRLVQPPRCTYLNLDLTSLSGIKLLTTVKCVGFEFQFMWFFWLSRLPKISSPSSFHMLAFLCICLIIIS